MRSILLITLREYLTRVNKRSFWLATFLVPLGFLALMLVQVIILAFSGESVRVAVVNEDKALFSDRTMRDGANDVFFVQSNVPLQQLKTSYKTLDFDGILYIPSLNLSNPNGVRYISDEVLSMTVRQQIKLQIEDEIKRLRLLAIGINQDSLNQKIEQLSVNIIEEDPQGGTNKNAALATGVGFGMGFLMYMVIFIYGAMVMRGVMEEKSNRIVEVMLSAVRPFQLMMGKILGIGCVAITQFLLWAALLISINLLITPILALAVGDVSTLNSTSTYNNAEAEAMKNVIEEAMNNVVALPIETLLIGFFFYFVCGYIFYAALYAGLASAINDETDAQSLTFPVSVPIIIAIFILSAVAENPSSSLAFWSSMIPFFSPIIMPFRIAFGVPLWELGLSMLLTAIGTFASVWLAARIYRIGILLYGKKVNFKEIGKWMWQQ